jgi:predicted Fe-S protein YdhL (DUF1289 family)
MISPCVSRCELDPETRTCYGCNRTQMEIFLWAKYTEEERMAIMRRLGYGRRRPRMSQEEILRRYEHG